jgi:hypothetical protein
MGELYLQYLRSSEELTFSLENTGTPIAGTVSTGKFYPILAEYTVILRAYCDVHAAVESPEGSRSPGHMIASRHSRVCMLRLPASLEVHIPARGLASVPSLNEDG